MSTKRKTYTAPLGLKSGEAGQFLARFASIGPPPDHDGDITEPGAFRSGAKVPIGAYNHRSDLPCGSGVIEANDREALVRGRFFLNTDHGRQTYETLKALSDDMTVEWSYVFSIEASKPGVWQGQPVRYLRKLDVFSVDPVLRGAGRDTALLDLKRGGAHPEVDLDPANALLDIEFAEAALGHGGGPRTSADPAEAMKAMRRQMTPTQLLKQIDEIGRDVEEQLLRLAVETMGTEPERETNLAALIRAAQTMHPGAAERYIEHVVRSALAARAANLTHLYGGHSSDAWQVVDQWARGELGTAPSVMAHQGPPGTFLRPAGDF